MSRNVPVTVFARRSRTAICAGWLVVLVGLPARAADRAALEPPSALPEPGSSGERAEPTPERRALSAGAAVVPGALVHGAGHYVLGRRTTARRLLLLEGIGLGMFLAGGATIVATGASRHVVGPAAAVTASGVGLFAISFLADLYGVSVPEDERGTARVLPEFESSLGYRYVYDPQFSYRHFMVQAIEARWGRLRLLPSAWFALDDRNARYRLGAAWQLVASRPADAAVRDGSYLELRTAATHHRYDPEQFSISTGELSIDGRLDLRHIDEHLTGMFAELGTGLGLQGINYDVEGLEGFTDVEELLLGRFGFGVYIGDPSRRGGEITAYYDHRHDGYTAGLKLTGLGSGVVGHFGLLGRYYFDQTWGALVNAEVGSAYLLGLSVLFRQQVLP